MSIRIIEHLQINTNKVFKFSINMLKFNIMDHRVRASTKRRRSILLMGRTLAIVSSIFRKKLSMSNYCVKSFILVRMWGGHILYSCVKWPHVLDVCRRKKYNPINNITGYFTFYVQLNHLVSILQFRFCNEERGQYLPSLPLCRAHPTQRLICLQEPSTEYVRLSHLSQKGLLNATL